MCVSVNVENSSEFKSFWKPIIRAFQIFCVSNYSIFRSNLNNHFIRFALCLPYFVMFSVINISIVGSTASRGLQCDGALPESVSTHKESALMYYVNSLSVLGNFFTHLTIHLETFLCGKQEEAIFEKLNGIDDIFERKLNHKINYKSKRSTCIRKAMSVFILSTVLSICGSFISLPELHHDKYFMQPILIVAATINRIRWMYIAIILCSLADTLQDLQMLLRQQQIQSCEKSDDHGDGLTIAFARDNIRYFREIYSSIWLTITLLSSCFGWTFITFLVSYTFQTINALYWLYINLSVYKSMNLNIRKYLLFTIEDFNLKWIKVFRLLILCLFLSFYAKDIVLFLISNGIILCMFCTLSERCQKMVINL